MIPISTISPVHGFVLRENEGGGRSSRIKPERGADGLQGRRGQDVSVEKNRRR